MAKAQVVIFDDEREILETLGEFLKLAGVSSVRMELVDPNDRTVGFYRAVLEEARPRLVITDWSGIGEKVLEAVESLDYRPKVVVFSSEPDTARKSSRAALVNDFVVKPPESWAAFVQRIVGLLAAPEGSS